MQSKNRHIINLEVRIAFAFIISSILFSFSLDMFSQVTEEWVARYNGLGSTNSDAQDIIVDNEGYVYVTGYHESPESGYDVATVKYNNEGKEEWVAVYNGPANSSDYAYKIALDSSGNIYVTGGSIGLGTYLDYVTIKYNNLGEEQWVARYNGNGNKSDCAEDIVVDNASNIYVTGYSVGSEISYDYTTIKYNDKGVLQWVATYNSPGNGSDLAEFIRLDGLGNIYVTGESGYDFATVKYNNEGVEQWVKRYGAGPPNPDSYSGSPQDMEVDNYGNVYITGYIVREVYHDGHYYYIPDYITIKYNTEGNVEWAKSYGTYDSTDEAYALVVDSLSNVYVTGVSEGEVTTIKYNSGGVIQWVAKWSELNYWSHEPRDIDIDSSGNIYITGRTYSPGTLYDYITLKYNNDGVEQWVAKYNGPNNGYDTAYALALDSSSNVYVTGAGSTYLSDPYYSCYTTLKYSNDGVCEWTARYSGPGSKSDTAKAIAVDNSGNVYVTGGSFNGYSITDFATIKYNSEGMRQWVKRYNGPGDSTDYANAIAIDSGGNIYVTGVINILRSPPYDYDYATIKYNSNGDEQWIATYNGLGLYRSYDGAIAMVLDNFNNIYVTGISQGADDSLDYATIKYNSSGEQQWVARYSSPGTYSDYATDIAVDNSCNVYVTGYSNIEYDQFATVKYNSEGIEQWVMKYSGTVVGNNRSQAIVVDSEGNVYITGYCPGSTGMPDYATIKYNTDGIMRWIVNYNGPFSHIDISRDIAVDESGNIYVTGESVDFTYSYNYVTIKYNSNGEAQWIASYNNLYDDEDKQTPLLTLDKLGNIYVVGSCFKSPNSFDYVAIKYNVNGAQQWVMTYNGPGNSIDEAKAIAIDDLGNIYVTGESEGSVTDYDYATIKYSQSVPPVFSEMFYFY